MVGMALLSSLVILVFDSSSNAALVAEDSNPVPETRILELEGSSDDGGAEGTACSCGHANKVAGRIRYGTETGEGEYPFMAFLRSNKRGYLCGASIISQQHVLLAAHCFRMIDGEKFQDELSSHEVFVGGHLCSGAVASHGMTKKLKVKEVVVHPKWLGKHYKYDIAILVLEEPIEFNQYVRPVCLSPVPMGIIGQYITALGFGQTEVKTKTKPLRQAHLLAVDCTKPSVKTTCFQRGQSEASSGDSGGPFLYLDPDTNRYVQVAVISHRTDDFIKGVNTDFYYDWIQKTVKDTSEYDICSMTDGSTSFAPSAFDPRSIAMTRDQ